jgi:hypothetical protein
MPRGRRSRLEPRARRRVGGVGASPAPGARQVGQQMARARVQYVTGGGSSVRSANHPPSISAPNSSARMTQTRVDSGSPSHHWRRVLAFRRCSIHPGADKCRFLLAESAWCPSAGSGSRLPFCLRARSAVSSARSRSRSSGVRHLWTTPPGCCLLTLAGGCPAVRACLRTAAPVVSPSFWGTGPSHASHVQVSNRDPPRRCRVPSCTPVRPGRCRAWPKSGRDSRSLALGVRAGARRAIVGVQAKHPSPPPPLERATCSSTT